MKELAEEVQFTIFISDNNLYAYLELLRVSDASLPHTRADQILEKLKELNVCSGIDESLIKKNLQQFYSNHIAPPPPPILIAQGRKPEHKQDTGIQWLIEPAAKHEYERVIAPDHPIGHTISHQEGKPGRDVFNQEIEPVEMSDLTISEGEGVYQKTLKDEQGNDQIWYYSQYLGIVTLRDDCLSVKPLIEVDEKSPYSAYIELYGFLGDSVHSRVKVSHIFETLKRMKITHGWNANLLIAALHVAHRRRCSELEQDRVEKLLLLSSKRPVDAQYGKIQWKVKHDSEEDIDKIVSPGQTIASYECVSEGEAGVDIYGQEVKSQMDIEEILEAGNSVEVYKDDKQYKYRAKILGLVEHGKQISLKSLLEISEDKLQADVKLPVFPKDSRYRTTTLTQVQKTLEFENICYGVEQDALEKILEAIKSGKQTADENSSFYKTIAARGKKPKDGIDANIELNQQISAGKLMKNGRIDFKERSYPWNVKEGDEIGHIIPMVAEEDGMDIYQQAIAAKKPKDIELTLDGLHQASDGHLFTDKSGTLIVNKQQLSVTDTLVLEGNVDNETGNIHTDSTVIVKGRIDPGFVVETSADICIDANIERAVAIAKGNVIIRGGVRGEGSRITADGEVNATFMEHAQVQSKVSIIISESLVDCQLTAREEIIVGEDSSPKTSIVGGRTHAYQKVSAGSLGNTTNIKTDILVGYTREDQEKYDALKQEIEDNQKELERIEELYVSGAAEKENMTQLMEQLEPLGIKIEEQKKQLAALKEMMESCSNSTVEFYNSTYPGVRITICGYGFVVEHIYKQGIFYLKENKVQFESR
ncbi:MAG: FapA family protein [gamma proteobacterium symbiont of Taylorina sp.]|nr:FapA family protein [gamma proteobacterium symbiont of Taylorina sp.]